MLVSEGFFPNYTSFALVRLAKRLLTLVYLSHFFFVKPPILMILVLGDTYESPLSIDTKKVPVVLHLTSQRRFNDARVHKRLDFARVLDENRPNFKFSPKILGISDFDESCLLIVKGNDYYNIHRKFQVHSSNIFCLGSKNKYREDSRGGSPPP